MDADHDEEPTTIIVEKIADREGVDPREIEPPLGSVVDTDALDALVAFHENRGPPQDGFARFSYHGYVVTLRFSGRVSVEEDR